MIITWVLLGIIFVLCCISGWFKIGQLYWKDEAELWKLRYEEVKDAIQKKG